MMLRSRNVVLAAGIGALLGVFLLHPSTMAIYWLEFRSDLAQDWKHIGHFLGARTAASFTLQMLPMTALFALLGACMGGIYAVVEAKLRRSASTISHLEREMVRDVRTLLRLGESAHVEFKSTARWDLRTGKVNKALAGVVAKTIAAFGNHEGGSLLIGVDDNGSLVGLAHDYRTLKSANRDGFSQFLMVLVRERLGGHVCRIVHVLFTELDGHDVCRVIVEPADEPIYLLSAGKAQFFVRTGNTSRSLDARETVQYVAARWKALRKRSPLVTQ